MKTASSTSQSLKSGSASHIPESASRHPSFRRSCQQLLEQQRHFRSVHRRRYVHEHSPDSHNAASKATCTEYLAGVGKSKPIFPTARTAAYSNMGYPLLAIILSRLENKPFAQLFQHHLITPLNLTSTSYTVPTSVDYVHDVVPTEPTLAGWSSSMGLFTPSCGNFAFTRDMASIGRASSTASFLTRLKRVVGCIPHPSSTTSTRPSADHGRFTFWRCLEGR